VDTYKIAIFFDGTWNTVDDEHSFSNVKKLKDLTVEKYNDNNHDDHYITDVHYEEGPGTNPQYYFAGGAFAADLGIPILNAYNWLCRRYINYAISGIFPEIYLFGFSRGAYICHVFSWILSEIGITKDISLCEKIINSYVDKNTDTLERLTNAESYEKYQPVIRMLGLWDMVSAPLDIHQNYNDGVAAPIVKTIYHAMSLDEKRTFFPVSKYPNNDSKIQQHWFSGVHSDVGGGYEDDNTLSNISLAWMVQCACDEDLILKDIKAEGYPISYANEPANDIQKIDFLKLKIHDESGSQNNPRTCEGEPIDISVRLRMAQNASYHPKAKDFPL